jgi:hypothetical protein
VVLRLVDLEVRDALKWERCAVLLLSEDALNEGSDFV